MQLVKTLLAILGCSLTAIYAATNASGSTKLDLEDDQTGARALPPAVTSMTINSKTPFELLESGELAYLMRKEPFTIDGTNEAGEVVKIPAERNVLIGYVMSVPAGDERQTVLLDYKKSAGGAHALTLGLTGYVDNFYPEDPREILAQMYAAQKTEEELANGNKCCLRLGHNLVSTQGLENMVSEPGMYVYDGKISMPAQNFAVAHGTLLASPLPMEFMPLGNPIIRSIMVQGRPFFKEIEDLPVCFHATLLEMRGNPAALRVQASFVGALHKSAMQVLFDASIIPASDFQKFMAAQQVKEQSQTVKTATAVDA
jgi:hypothetical protein